jgi:hypothetical protein
MMTVIFALFTAAILHGQEVPKTEQAGPDSAGRYVSIDKIKTGENVLVVRYPWRVHEKASIEVRLITEKKDMDARVRPLRFATLHFGDDAERRILRASDNALAHPSDGTAEAGGLTWRIVARGNHLGRAAVWFVNAAKKDSSLPGTAAALSPLDPWAIGDRLLMLDLPHDSFAQPGKLHVWFLRGERILWHEELSWPGQK